MQENGLRAQVAVNQPCPVNVVEDPEKPVQPTDESVGRPSSFVPAGQRRVVSPALQTEEDTFRLKNKV
jgi:hypothetical protein